MGQTPSWLGEASALFVPLVWRQLELMLYS